MRDIPGPLAAALAGEVTTLARCWVVTRGDGAVLGFTDHDRDLAVAGVLCRAASGVGGSEATRAADLAVPTAEIAGALDGEALDEAELAAGVWDGARVDVHAVDWTDPAAAMQVARGEIGEVRREGQAFVAELRGVAHRLAEPRGRLFAASCDAILGDARCRVDLAAPAFRAEGTIAATDGRLWLESAALAPFAAGWFAGGVLTLTSGAEAGRSHEVAEHAGARLALVEPLGRPIAAGDGFTVTAGCDKRHATCVAKFANAVNFRGFPHMPGTDRALAAPSRSDPQLDGGSYFR